MRFRSKTTPGLALLLAACGSTSGHDATNGRRVTLAATIAADAEARAPFTTNFGWNVTLTKAATAYGAFYFFDGPPAFTRVTPRPTWDERVWRVLGLGTAYAHPGHYQAGDALGEILVPGSYDLLAAAPQTVGSGDGVTGDYQSGRFLFADGTSGPASGELGGAAAYVEGQATKADGSSPAPIFFAASATLADIEGEASGGAIDGCVFDARQVTASGTVAVTVNPRVWVDYLDFSTVAPGSADAPTVLAAGSHEQHAFVLGVSQLDAYRFHYSTP